MKKLIVAAVAAIVFIANIQRFSFGRALNQDNTYEDSNIQNSSFSASAEMPLFTGFKTSASITRNKFDILAAEANKELIENNLSLNVTNYYFQILLNKEIYRIAQEQIRLTKEQEIRTRILIELFHSIKIRVLISCSFVNRICS